MTGHHLLSAGSLRSAMAAAALASLWLGSALPAGAAETAETAACHSAGSWLDPETGAALTSDQLLASLARHDIVLLGESHTSRAHHRWQLHTLAGLNAYEPKVAVGFEMFPRAVQAALDDWSQGQSSEAEFLRESDWHHSWGYDSALYLPLFHLVRQNRLPMFAMNVERDLVSRVGDEGWQAIPEHAREGLSDPAPASAAYRESLAQVYAQKRRHREGAVSMEEIEAEEVAEILADDGFERFVEAQLTWDRAMAEALVQARKQHPDALLVGILGRGHIEHGHGVPHQLAALGEDKVAVLLPVAAGAACETLASDVADAVFLLDPGEEAAPEPSKPRLGVIIEQTDKGVRVLDIVDGSVAEATGLEAGDIIVRAASFPVSRVAELIEIIQRQAPGTWLPLELERGGETRELVAEFPARFD